MASKNKIINMNLDFFKYLNVLLNVIIMALKFNTIKTTFNVNLSL